jgi:hypothetical protein
MGRRTNEAEACEVVVRLLERRTGTKRGSIRRPDDEPCETVKLDYLVEIGKENYALEHTILEAIDREIGNFNVVVARIAEHCRKVFPQGVCGTSGCYELVVPVEVDWPDESLRTAGARRRRQAALRRLTDWIQQMVGAPAQFTEPGRSLNRTDREDCVDPPDLGLKTIRQCAKIRLRRWPDAAFMGRAPGCLRITRAGVEDFHGDRSRLRRAFSDKWPKLKVWGTRGARTVLVLACIIRGGFTAVSSRRRRA